MLSSTGNVTIQASPLTHNISPYGFHRYAYEFHSAATTYQSPSGFSPVPYYLECRAVELLFKAFLLARGYPKKDLKSKIGHDLVKALKKANKHGLGSHYAFTSAQERELAKANAYYKSKGFEYFNVCNAATGYQKLPNLNVLSNIVGLLIQSLEMVCKNA